MAYTPPAADQLNFTLKVYTPPAAHQVDFVLDPTLPLQTASVTTFPLTVIADTVVRPELHAATVQTFPPTVKLGVRLPQELQSASVSALEPTVHIGEPPEPTVVQLGLQTLSAQAQAATVAIPSPVVVQLPLMTLTAATFPLATEEPKRVNPYSRRPSPYTRL